MASSEEVEQLTVLSGMIRRSRIIAGEVRSSVVSALNTQFGVANVRIAIANRDLSLLSSTNESTDLAMLPTFFATEGHVCLSAWMACQSASIAGWTRMKLENDQLIDAINSDHQLMTSDCMILRRAGAALFNLEGTEDG